jgi:hypothetical protein
MHAHEIARQDWRRTLDALSRDHYGQLVTVETDLQDLGAHAEVLQLPLIGVSLEECTVAPSIAITMGGIADGGLTQLIDRPVRLFVKHTAAEPNAGIEVESADHTWTIVRFR